MVLVLFAEMNLLLFLNLKKTIVRKRASRTKSDFMFYVPTRELVHDKIVKYEPSNKNGSENKKQN